MRGTRRSLLDGGRGKGLLTLRCSWLVSSELPYCSVAWDHPISKVSSPWQWQFYSKTTSESSFPFLSTTCRTSSINTSSISLACPPQKSGLQSLGPLLGAQRWQSQLSSTPFFRGVWHARLFLAEAQEKYGLMTNS